MERTTCQPDPTRKHNSFAVTGYAKQVKNKHPLRLECGIGATVTIFGLDPRLLSSAVPDQNWGVTEN